jgi:hypothetical protein
MKAALTVLIPVALFMIALVLIYLVIFRDKGPEDHGIDH